jgi:hypothetical protein
MYSILGGCLLLIFYIQDTSDTTAKFQQGDTRGQLEYQVTIVQDIETHLDYDPSKGVNQSLGLLRE